MARIYFLLLSLVSVLSPVLAQTFTDCNPMERTDCPANPALGTNVTFDFSGRNKGDDQIWNVTNGKIKWGQDGAEFTINGKRESPTMKTNFYIFFGVVTVMMKAAPGRGIVSSIVLQSEDLDEVDWELIGGNDTHVQSNYFGKGNITSFDRDAWHPTAAPQDNFINYTTVWTKEKLEWYVAGDLVRTLKYNEALNGYNFPQTPMNIRLGVWSGGDRDYNNNGTVEWAGGETDFGQAPFTMTVKSVYAQDFSSAKEYQWTDKTGSFESIKAIQGKSVAEARITEPQGIIEKFKALPSTTRIGILAGSIGGAVLLIGLITFCCIRQRSRGRKEHHRLEEQYHKEIAEREAHRRREFGFDG